MSAPPAAASSVVQAIIEDLLNGANPLNATRLLASSFLDHSPCFDHPPTREGWLMSLGVLRQSFPDLVFNPARLVSEADLVAYQGTWRGTHRDTGKHIEVGEHRLFRVLNGQAVEHWQEQDTSGLLRQLA